MKWIKIEDQQPPKEGEASILLYSKQADCYWGPNDCGCDDYHAPTHWMQLPEAPE